jgi:hypothetical protein
LLDLADQAEVAGATSAWVMSLLAFAMEMERALLLRAEPPVVVG